MQILTTLTSPFLALPAPAPGHSVSPPELLLSHLPPAHVSRCNGSCASWGACSHPFAGTRGQGEGTAAPEPPRRGRAAVPAGAASARGPGALPAGPSLGGQGCRTGGAGEHPAPPRGSPARPGPRCHRSHRSRRSGSASRPHHVRRARPQRCGREGWREGGTEGRRCGLGWAGRSRRPSPRSPLEGGRRSAILTAASARACPPRSGPAPLCPPRIQRPPAPPTLYTALGTNPAAPPADRAPSPALASPSPPVGSGLSLWSSAVNPGQADLAGPAEPRWPGLI